MTFMYDDKAQVTCTEKTVEALAGKSGAILKVTYREEGGERIATRIEGAALSPSAKRASPTGNRRPHSQRL
ncbi:MAG TPA: hypothetical protein VKK06_20625 [Terriglobia bacterium]|nr:hypothetical protein [Terriglobia bacterium]